MPSTPSPPTIDTRVLETRFPGFLVGLARRWPFLSFFLLVIVSNAAGSFFNISYNRHLIVELYLDPPQEHAFWFRIIPVYNTIAYTLAFALIIGLFRPIARCLKAIRADLPIAPDRLAHARRRLINLPVLQVCLNFALWIPGAILFPLGICLAAGWNNASVIWTQFAVSFTISALLTSVQTYFLIDEFLIAALYGELFREARPAMVHGAWRVTFGRRVFLLWCSVAAVPILALVVVALHLDDSNLSQLADLRMLSVGVAAVGLPLSGFLMWMVGGNILRWVRAHAAAAEAVARGNLEVRIREQRPDEWGLLTDGFNDMASALERARYVRETFGQFVSSEVCEEILDHHPGLGGEIREVTALFADIRGFTKRSCGESPEKVVELLNRFLTLSVGAVEGSGGWVNKFLGDGFMALFGAPRARADHPDLALEAALRLLDGLAALNLDLENHGCAPLRVGIGIHTGQALVGCVGAALGGGEGGAHMRREYTAMGETINLAQRMEQLTKVHGGPILATRSTVERLRGDRGATFLGAASVPGFAETVDIYRIGDGWEAGK